MLAVGIWACRAVPHLNGDPHGISIGVHPPGQATCEGRGFLPIILRVSSSLVASIQFFLADGKQVNWNVSPRNAESF